MSYSLQPHGLYYTVHGVLQARILERISIPFSRGSSQTRDWTWSPMLQVDSLPAEPPGKPNKYTYTTRYISRKIKSKVSIYLHTCVCSNIIHNNQAMKPPKYLWLDEWINKMCLIQGWNPGLLQWQADSLTWATREGPRCCQGLLKGVWKGQGATRISKNRHCFFWGKAKGVWFGIMEKRREEFGLIILQGWDIFSCWEYKAVSSVSVSKDKLELVSLNKSYGDVIDN